MRGRPGAEAMAAAGAASMAALSPHVAAAVAAAVAAGGSRHVVAATASAAIRVAMACAAGDVGDGHGSASLSSGGSEAAALCSETRPRGGSEVAARVDAILCSRSRLPQRVLVDRRPLLAQPGCCGTLPPTVASVRAVRCSRPLWPSSAAASEAAGKGPPPALCRTPRR